MSILSGLSVASVAGRNGVVVLAVADVSGAAPLASPTFTGTVTAPTASATVNTTQVATTAMVQAAIVAAGPTRIVTGIADTPTVADNNGLVVCTSSSATTITANDLSGYRSYSILQAGVGQVTVAAGAGITLTSDKATASYATARRGSVLTIICDGAARVYVIGATA